MGSGEMRTPEVKRPKMPMLASRKQRGVALFVSLVLLLVLTIAGVSAVQTTSLEERMARNTHDNLMAFMAAEAALREGEDVVEDTIDEDSEFDAGTDGYWAVASFGEDPVWQDVDLWDDDSAGSVQAGAAIPYVQQQPRYIIEYIAQVIEDNEDLASDEEIEPPIIHMYRITALGVGGTENARVMLQSVYGKFL